MDGKSNGKRKASAVITEEKLSITEVSEPIVEVAGKSKKSKKEKETPVVKDDLIAEDLDPNLMDYITEGAFANQSRSFWQKHFLLRRDPSTHIPTQFPGRNTKSASDACGSDSRLRCKVCKAKSSFYCRQCGVALCIKKPRETACWETFHHDEYFP